MAAIGPHWSWNEVWLIAFGGTFLLAFPKVMATSFAGFYLALWFVLWSFILRGISIEVGGHIHDTLWQSWWDFVFAVSSVALAVLFGAAFGNVIRGVPLDESGGFSMSLFTHFGVHGRVGILKLVHRVRCGVHHGPALSTWRNLPPTQDTRASPSAQRAPRPLRLWATACLLFVVISLETWVVRPALYVAMFERPVAWLAIAVVLAGAWALFRGLRGEAEGLARPGACAVIAGLLAGAAASVFPVMLHSTLAPEHAVTAYTGAAPAYRLAMALIWWPVALLLAFAYLIVIRRERRGKIRPTDDTHGYS